MMKIDLLGDVLRITLLVIVLTLLMGVEIDAGKTNNWYKSLEMGLLMHDSKSSLLLPEKPQVEAVNIAGNASVLLKPLVTSNHHTLITDEMLNSCRSVLEELDTGASVEEFTSFFAAPNALYFPFSKAIAVLVITSLIVSMVSDSSTKTMQLFNVAVTLAVAVMLILTSVLQSFLVVGNCSLQCLRSDRTAYCAAISSCGMMVASVAHPHFLAAKYFRMWTMPCGAALLVTALFKARNMVKAAQMEQVHPLRDADGGRDPPTFSFTAFANGTHATALYVAVADHDLLGLGSEECSICLTPLCLAAAARCALPTGDLESGPLASAKSLPPDPSSAEPQATQPHPHPQPQLQDTPAVAGPAQPVRLACNHMFHAACIARWARRRNASCPVCRTQLVPSQPHLPIRGLTHLA